MNLLANFFGALALLSNIFGIQSKKKKYIMISFILANLFLVINFILLKAYSGAIICFISVIETSINYIYDKNKRKYPVALICIYIIISLICGLFAFKNVIDILPVLSSIIFAFTIIQKKERNIRILTLSFISLFVAYDFIVGAYAALLSAVIYCISIAIAIIRYDILKKKI